MCGIAGVYNPLEITEGVLPVLKKMLGRIHYRGPDESGIYCDYHIAMGNVRLSILDIAGGQQPIAADHNNLWIVLNGEIFNYLELRKDLERLGHEFITKSDTEVLLHAYQQYGSDCLPMLNGQFSMAIWDRRKNELFLARDRVGIRPLFYTWHENKFIFGSEIKAILEYPGIPRSIDAQALSHVFTFWTTLPDQTVFKNICQLPPGHFMKVSFKQFNITQWWKLSFAEKYDQSFSGTFDEAKEELHLLLRDAVRIRLRADVPVAAYLSGGLDSSATTSLIKQIQPDILRTFSIGFQNEEFDETHYQHLVANYLHTEHTSFSCLNDEIGKLFPLVVWHAETPILRTAPVPMYCLAEKVRMNHIKVVITGEGADEMLAGYDIFKETVIRDFWSRQPDSKLRPLLLQKLYPYLNQFKGRSASMLKFFYGFELSNTSSPYYSHLVRWNNGRHLLNYFNEDFKTTCIDSNSLKALSDSLLPGFENWHKLSQAQWLEITLFMSGYLLSSQGDRMAMAHSIEGRYPFLDYRVMELAAKLPPEYKLKGLNEKYILKKMMQNELPESILKRPKQAYRAPVADSLLNSTNRNYVDDLLSQSSIQQARIFDFNATQNLINKLKQKEFVSEMENMALAGILSTQILFFQYINPDASIVKAIPELTHCKIENYLNKN